jgi:6-phosphogluconolactonase (cycloisomerase 2 family)
MLQKALVLFCVLAGIAGCVSCSSTSSHYVYATVPAANQVVIYREDPNSGILTQLLGSPYSVGEGARSLVLHPSGKFMYVANPGQGGTAENDISLFSIASNGGLTEVTPRTPLGTATSTPQLLLIDSAGAFLYVMNTGSNNISVFSIDSGSGALTQVTGSPGSPGSPFGIGAPPLNMLLSPSGNFLFVSLASQPSGLIATYSVNSGQLTLVSVTSTDGENPFGLAINSAGTYLYAANSGNSNSISVFTVDSSGGLAQVVGSPINNGSNTAPIAMAFDVSGNYLYVANQGSNNVTSYSIGSTGFPTLTTTTGTNTFATETSPSVLVVDPGGKYLLVGSQGTSAGIQAFSISSGSLTALYTYPIGNTPSSIVILK